MAMIGQAGVAIEIATEVMTIVISVEERETEDTEMVMVEMAVAVAVAVVFAMHGKKVTVQEVHHAGSLTKTEAEVVAVLVVGECAMTIKVGDVTGEILVDSHMKMVVVVVDEGMTVVDEEGKVDVEMVDAVAETGMVVEVVVEEVDDRSVAVMQEGTEMADPLEQKTVFGRMECFTKEDQATKARLARALVAAQIHAIAQNLAPDHEIGECRYQRALADQLPVMTKTNARNRKLLCNLQQLSKKPCLRLEEEFKQPWKGLLL